MVAISVVLIIVGLLLLDLFVQFAESWLGRGHKAAAQSGLKSEADGAQASSFPPGLFFDRGHAWARLEPSGEFCIGLDSDIAGVLGEVDEIALPQLGASLRAGEPLATLRLGKHVLTVRSPVEGQVHDVNHRLTSAALIASPYERGWLCTMSPVALARDTRRLVVGEEAQDWRRVEAQQLREFLSAVAVVPGRSPTLAALTDDQRVAFQRRFLDPALATTT